jgi:DNA-binding XRE family transcriptional regulator
MMSNQEKAPQKRRVLDELKRRARQGRALNSGANRGDWLYAAAVVHFGSWGAAVEAAGFAYSAIKIKPLTEQDVVRQIRALVATGDALYACDHRTLASAARRIFGSWNEAIVAAGSEVPDRRTWTRETVAEAIREGVKQGLPMNAVAVVERHEGLYKAGRGLFGSWAAAFDAATMRGTRRPSTKIAPTSVRQLRRKLGLDRDELAEKVGVSGKTVATWETEGVPLSSSGYIPVRQLMNDAAH